MREGLLWLSERASVFQFIKNKHGIFVRIDMEGSAYTERTLRLFAERVHPEFGDLSGVSDPELHAALDV